MKVKNYSTSFQRSRIKKKTQTDINIFFAEIQFHRGKVAVGWAQPTVFARKPFVLKRRLKPGDIVIWDNVAIHKQARIRARIEATGARIEPLPAYSPDLTPIEECISKIKSILRTLKAETLPALWRALKYAFAQISPQDIRG